MALFTEEGRKRIEDAIAALERRSATELVVATVPASDAYLPSRLLYAFSFGLLAQAGVYALWPELGLFWLTLAQLGGAFVAFLALGLRPLARVSIPRAHAHHSVQRRAHEEFFGRGLHRTAERTGVLIFLSELERQVVILGDEGIHARVQTDGWERHVASIVKQIRAGRAAEGVCEVIAALADVLERAVPARPDDVNELPNAVREEKR
jgi:putative membrane protein